MRQLVLQDILFFGDGCIFLDMVRVLSSRQVATGMQAMQQALWQV
jgi:hypothetical protein